MRISITPVMPTERRMVSTRSDTTDGIVLSSIFRSRTIVVVCITNANEIEKAGPVPTGFLFQNKAKVSKNRTKASFVPASKRGMSFWTCPKMGHFFARKIPKTGVFGQSGGEVLLHPGQEPAYEEAENKAGEIG